MKLFVKCPRCHSVLDTHELDALEAEIERRINSYRQELAFLKLELRKWERGKKVRSKC